MNAYYTNQTSLDILFLEMKNHQYVKFKFYHFCFIAPNYDLLRLFFLMFFFDVKPITPVVVQGDVALLCNHMLFFKKTTSSLLISQLLTVLQILGIAAVLFICSFFDSFYTIVSQGRNSVILSFPLQTLPSAVHVGDTMNLTINVHTRIWTSDVDITANMSLHLKCTKNQERQPPLVLDKWLVSTREANTYVHFNISDTVLLPEYTEALCYVKVTYHYKWANTQQSTRNIKGKKFQTPLFKLVAAPRTIPLIKVNPTMKRQERIRATQLLTTSVSPYYIPGDKVLVINSVFGMHDPRDMYTMFIKHEESGDDSCWIEHKSHFYMRWISIIVIVQFLGKIVLQKMKSKVHFSDALLKIKVSWY